jgi:RNA polymerase sigma factor for flagellar operon FliA
MHEIIQPRDSLEMDWSEYFSSRDCDSRNKLVAHYMELAKAIAARYFRRRIGGQAEFDDYLHYAILGLFQAIEAFDPKYNVKFETFATHRMRGIILNSLADLSERNSQIDRRYQRQQELLVVLGEFDAVDPDNEFIEGDLGEIADFALNVAYSFLLEEGLRFNSDLLPEMQDAYNLYEISDIKRVLKEIVKALPRNERAVMEFYYYYDLSFNETAEFLGMTKGRVSQLHKQTLRKIRAAYKKLTNISQTY